MVSRGLLLMLSSPSGAGKSSLARHLMDAFPKMQFSVSATTRPPRKGEVDGREYYFRSDAEFEAMVANGDMLEHAVVFENRYGTPRAPVVDAMEQGCDVIFDVDWQGGQQLRNSDLAANIVSVFVLPPSIKALSDRLTARGQDSPEVVASRMDQSRDEISHWSEYDYVLINDDFDTCAARLIHIVKAERLRRFRQSGLTRFVEGLNQEFATLKLD